MQSTVVSQIILARTVKSEGCNKWCVMRQRVEPTGFASNAIGDWSFLLRRTVDRAGVIGPGYPTIAQVASYQRYPTLFERFLDFFFSRLFAIGVQPVAFVHKQDPAIAQTIKRFQRAV